MKTKLFFFPLGFRIQKRNELENIQFQAYKLEMMRFSFLFFGASKNITRQAMEKGSYCVFFSLSFIFDDKYCYRFSRWSLFEEEMNDAFVGDMGLLKYININ